MSEWVVLKKDLDGRYSVTWVDVEAHAPEEAVREVALTHKELGGEGTYISIPSRYWLGYETTVAKIADVAITAQSLLNPIHLRSKRKSPVENSESPKEDI